MSIKKTMLLVWAVATLLWAGFFFHKFRLDEIGHAYRAHEIFAEKVARGRAADPFRWDYNQRGYERTGRLVEQANINLALFFLIALGLPGIVLAIGTIALANTDKLKKKNRKAA